MGLAEQVGSSNGDLATLLGLDISTSELADLSRRGGWNPVNFGFNLARASGGLDIQRGGERALIIPANPADQEALQLLTTHDLPHFRRSHLTATKITPLAAYNIDLVARALDSLRFPDQAITTGYLGSMDIMAALGKFLGRIYKKTQHLPNVIKLNQIALIPGGEQLVKLVPPISLQTTSDWEPIADQILADLIDQDPSNSHKTQVQMFRDYFELTLSQP